MNSNTVNLTISVNAAGKDKKPFYHRVGDGFVAGPNGQNYLSMQVLPNVVLHGGLIRVAKDQVLPENLPDTLDLKVPVVYDDGQTRNFTIGSAFAVEGKAGMYSLHIPKDLGVTGHFVLMPRQQKTNQAQ